MELKLQNILIKWSKTKKQRNDSMFHKMIQGLKTDLKIKDLITWFVLCFVGVLLIYICIAKRDFNTSLLIETFGFSVVFVLLMIGTKGYGYFVDDYYQSLINRHNRKRRK